MSEMFHAGLDADLFALLPRRSRADPSDGEDRASPTEPTTPCVDPSTPHDIAALRDGNCSRADVQRISDHLGRCRPCRVLIAVIVADTTKVDSSTMPRRQAAATPPVDDVPPL